MKKHHTLRFTALTVIAFLIGCASSNLSGMGFRDQETVTGRGKGGSLDFIFNNQTLAHTTVTVSRSEWENLLANYDANPKNETPVHADYVYEKDGLRWEMRDIGLKIRGNTSRRRPEGPEGAFHHAHFGLDFEEWLPEGEDRKMDGALKGVILKFFNGDPAHVREVYSYDLFRRNGVWTAPRSAYTALTVKVGSKTVYYGVYEMLEQTNKQFLSARTAKEGGALKGNDGFVWKCLWPADLRSASDSSMGCENASLGLRFPYDLKTRKDELGEAKAQLAAFITELNALDESRPEEIKAWYESKMDVDLFLRTYATSVILGMWDDYWGNQNNYYAVFDEDGRFYFVPYDYDNTLGTSAIYDAGTQDPLAWGKGANRPLLDKLLAVPEYRETYLGYLRSFSGPESEFAREKSEARIRSWHSLIASRVPNDTDGMQAIADLPADWGSTPFYRLLSGTEETNYFAAKANAIEEAAHTAATAVFGGTE